MVEGSEAQSVEGLENVEKAQEAHKYARSLNGWGRTVIRIGGDSKTAWLAERNHTVKALLAEGGKTERRTLICEPTGVCRELRDGELDEKGPEEEVE